MIGLQHRALSGVKHLPVYGPDQRPPDLHAYFGIALLKIMPFSIELVLIGVGGVDGQFVNVNQIGFIDCVGPAKMLVVAVQHEGRPGEKTAGHIPALVALEHRLIPRDRPRIRLMGINQKAGCAIGRARRSYRHGIGPHRNGLVRDQKGVLAFQGKRRDSIAILRTVQLKQNPVEPIEEGCLEDKSGGYVLAGEWQRALYYLVLMKGRVVIHAVGICFQDLSHICRQVALIFGIDRFPYPQEVD